MKTKFLAAPLVALMFLSFATLASAHAVVKPNQAGIGAFQIFTLGIPSEKPVATVAVRLVLPDGLNYVTPNVKPGWKVKIKKQATGNQIKNDDGMMVAEEKPIEIDWTGGSIPAEQRDEFVFSAQVPAKATTLNWKVYQTYADGSILSWDQDPKAAQPKDMKGNLDFSKVGPYSQTQIVNDLSSGTSAPSPADSSKKQSATATTALVISIVALILAVIGRSRKKVKEINN